MAFEDSDIYQAILDGDLAALGCSVGAQDVNLRDSSGKSYLHICIELGQKELVEYLAQKVFLGFRDDNGHTAIDLAARYRMREVEHQLIRRVAGMQDSDDTQALLQLFQAGWRAWPPIPSHQDPQHLHLSPGYQCQLEILRLQSQVELVHQAARQGQLSTLKEALSAGEFLVLVCDHTGLPPLQKAVLFECLSVVRFLSHSFPHCVNHPDHMGRTALHYAAAYHEYQDNILYKQLIRAGAREDVTDLNGFKPTDFLADYSLFSIDHMREEIKGRLSRPPKDYSSQLSFQDSRGCPPDLKAEDVSYNHNVKRWRILASMASFTSNNTHRKKARKVPFEETRLYESIIINDVHSASHWLSQGEDVNQHSVEGWSYLHLAVAYNVNPGLLSLLLIHLSPAERDLDGVTALEMSMTTYKNCALTEVIMDVIVGRILAGDIPALQVLAQDGWQCWPDEDYVDTYLQSLIMPQMKQFLLAVPQFLSEVREVHQRAMLHQEVGEDSSLWHVLNSQAGVTTLDSAGLSLAHICIIFYNIKLLTRLLHAFPSLANHRDNAGRTPLHYAACLNDDSYMYTLLREAKARDDEEDVLGMRPVDYMTKGKEIVSPTIQELIRDKVYHPVVLKPLWPTCLLTAKMESSKLSEAIKTNDLNTVEALLADPSTDTSQRNSQGQGFLHHALLTGADLPVFTSLLAKVDIAIRDKNGDSIVDLLLRGLHPQEMKEAVDRRVREVVLRSEEDGGDEARRLLLSGWCYWPLSSQEAREQSPQAAQLLAQLAQLKGKVEAVHRAVHQGRSQDLPELLDPSVLATAADHTGLPPLHKAVLLRHFNVVQFFASHFPFTVHSTDNMGRTALHYAAALTNNALLYRTLREAGADPTARDLLGHTPKDYQLPPHSLQIAALTEKVINLESPGTKPERKEIASPADTPPSTSAERAQLSVSEIPRTVHRTPDNIYKPGSHRQRAPFPASQDGKYIARHLGRALTLALAEIVQQRPSDPIEYLGHWLYQYQKMTNDSD